MGVTEKCMSFENKITVVSVEFHLLILLKDKVCNFKQPFKIRMAAYGHLTATLKPSNIKCTLPSGLLHRLHRKRKKKTNFIFKVPHITHTAVLHSKPQFILSHSNYKLCTMCYALVFPHRGAAKCRLVVARACRNQRFILQNVARQGY